jgi:hypothetical protein
MSLLDIDLHRWTPVWVRNMRWSSVYTILKIHDPGIQYEPGEKWSGVGYGARGEMRQISPSSTAM